jgi:hypothetical protein
MRRLFLALLVAALPPAAVIFVLTGCLTLGAILHSDQESRRGHSQVWDAFPKGTERCEKYLPLLEPSASHRTTGDGKQETFEYRGVRRSEQQMAEALETIHRDMRERIEKNGGTLLKEFGPTIGGDGVKRFGFLYREGGRTGTIRGTVTPGGEAGAWDLECVLEEELPGGRGSSRE